MIKKKIKNSNLCLMKGDITDMEIDAIVFDIKENLQLGSGFGGAISVRGGPSIQEELNKTGKLNKNEAIVTNAGNLKSKYIVHVVGPKFQEDNTKEKLQTSILNSLKKAEEKGDIKSIAFPPLSAGLYGVPLNLCAEVMLNSIKEYLKGSTNIKEVVITLLDTREYTPFKAKLDTFN